jgi:hypothetical protein
MIEHTLWYSTALESHLKNLDFTADDVSDDSEYGKTRILKRIDPRTRSSDYLNALSFEIFDPLWMLSRQWQYGRFKAVDCGTPVMVKIKTEKSSIDHIQCKSKNANAVDESYFKDRPLEYEVEKQNVEITPYVRVESAMQLKKMLLAGDFSKEDFAFLYGEKFKLHDELAEIKKEDKKDDINSLKIENNSALNDFYKFYRNRSFDGYKVYLEYTNNANFLKEQKKQKLDEVFATYAEWFKNKFLPCGNKDENSYWSNEKLGYEVKVKQGENTYIADDYDTGKLSWYSFDYSEKEKNKGASSETEEKMLSYIPTPAKIPGAPSSRLWEFEDRKVNMGNCDTDYSFIGTAAIMQYVSMFSNDWMIMPLETETGTILDVKGIVVKDSFGDRFYINQDSEMLDEYDYGKIQRTDKVDYPQVIYTDRWNLFGTSYDAAYKNRNFGTVRGLLFPPTVLRCEESKPIEEVQFLRDEMANMVWGVETTLNNRCGGTMDGRTLSDKVLNSVDEANALLAGPQDETQDENVKDTDYSLLIQNRVPINWIPFVPEQVKGDCRNIAFRRGRMPIYYNDKYRTVAPSTDLLGYKRDDVGHVKAFYVNEEEVATCGIKITKTAQRTRWFYGKSFNWIGNREVISEYQANSGLLFDELISKSTGKAITLNAEKEEPQPEETETAR